MGLYMCIADNGILPKANQSFQLEVYCKLIYKSCSYVLLFARERFLGWFRYFVTVFKIISIETESVKIFKWTFLVLRFI